MTNPLSVVAQSITDELVCSAASQWELQHGGATEPGSATSVTHGALAPRTVDPHVRFNTSTLALALPSAATYTFRSVNSPMHSTHTGTLARTRVRILAQIPLMKQHGGVEGRATAPAYLHGNRRRAAYSTQQTVRE